LLTNLTQTKRQRWIRPSERSEQHGRRRLRDVTRLTATSESLRALHNAALLKKQ